MVSHSKKQDSGNLNEKNYLLSLYHRERVMVSYSKTQDSGDSKEKNNIFEPLSVGAIVSAITGLLAASGFLATRSYINTLGLPSHVSVSVEAYIQYGGRFIFTAIIHMALAGFFVYLVSLLIRKIPLSKKISSKSYLWGIFLCTAMLTIGLELFIISGTASQFEPGSALKLREISLMDISFLIFLELLVLAVILFSVELWRNIYKSELNGIFIRIKQLCFTMMSLSSVLLLPVVFAGIVMPADKYNHVEIMLDEQKPIKGTHIFTDANDYYIWDQVSKQIIQVNKSKVIKIKYVSLN